MKILHTEASCGWGGQEIRILEESRGLIARGHEISIACPAHARMTEEAPRFGVPVAALPIEFKTFAGFFAVRKYLQKFPVDVVNTHSSADSWLVALACATLSRPPAIVRTRHISAPVSDNPFTRWLYRQASTVVTTGERLRRHLIDALALDPERVTSVPTGIDIDRFMPAEKHHAKLKIALDPSKTYLGIVATLRSWKGHLFLLDAFAKLRQPGLHLLIVGDGPMRKPIEENIAALGLAEHVTLVGQRTDPEVWFQAIDIFCLPSYANEGVPQALLQAMLCALPIVTTPVGAILEAVTHEQSALIVPPKDSATLAMAINRLLDNPDFAGALGLSARQHASTFYAREIMVTRMASIFQAATK